MIFESFILNLFILLALIIALIFDYVTKFFSYWYIRHVPYKSAIPFFGSDYHRVLGLRNTSSEVQQLYSQYPEDKFVGCIKSRIPDLIVKDPDAVRKILSADFSNFNCRGLGLDKSRDVCLRNNLFYAEGEKWALLRRELDTLLQNMNSKIQGDLHVCLSGINGDTNVQQILSELLDIVFKDLLIGNNGEQSIITCLRKQSRQRSFQDKIMTYLKNIFPSLHVLLGVGTDISRHCHKYQSVINATKLYEDIKKAEIPSPQKLTTKSKKRDSDENYAFSVLGMFITEGYLPCHHILTSLLFQLARNVQVQERVRSENNHLVLAIKETLRLHPPYSVISRKCTKMYTFAEADFLVDKGVTITVPIEAIHRDENNFSDALSFKPERFENKDDLPAFMPFGVGPRNCIGAELAMNIITAISRVLVNNFHIGTCEMTPTELRIVDKDFGRVIEGDVWLKLRPINENKK